MGIGVVPGGVLHAFRIERNEPRRSWTGHVAGSNGPRVARGGLWRRTCSASSLCSQCRADGASKSEAIRMLIGSGIGAGLALAVLAEISVRLNGNGGAPSAPGWR